jgi:hypothetical protein
MDSQIITDTVFEDLVWLYVAELSLLGTVLVAEFVGRRGFILLIFILLI